MLVRTSTPASCLFVLFSKSRKTVLCWTGPPSVTPQTITEAVSSLQVKTAAHAVSEFTLFAKDSEHDKVLLWGTQMQYLLCWSMKDLSNISTFSKLHRNTCPHNVKPARLSYSFAARGLQPVRLLCPWVSRQGTLERVHSLHCSVSHPCLCLCVRIVQRGLCRACRSRQEQRRPGRSVALDARAC